MLCIRKGKKKKGQQLTLQSVELRSCCVLQFKHSAIRGPPLRILHIRRHSTSAFLKKEKKENDSGQEKNNKTHEMDGRE